MRINRIELHTATANLQRISGKGFTDHGLPLQSVWKTGNFFFTIAFTFTLGLPATSQVSLFIIGIRHQWLKIYKYGSILSV